MGLEEDGAECGREGKGVDGGEADGNSHGNTELTVEGAAGTAEEADGDEHGHHDKGDGDDGAAEVVHGVERCLAGRGVAHVELGVDTFDDNDGVIDDDGDGKDEG